jgi:hypothetical protein
MATTTTYYTYDKSGRMTTQWSFDTVSATYFVYNQRDMVTQFYPTSGDSNRYFAYNGLGERVIVNDGAGPTYWTYDGRKLLTEKTTAGTATRRYRHNESQQEDLGANVEMNSASFGKCTPATDRSASLGQLVNAEGTDVFETSCFGDVLASINNLGYRLRLAQSLGTQALTTTLPFYITASGGVYFSRIGIAFGGDEEWRGAFGLVVASLLLDCGGRGLAAVQRRRRGRKGDDEQDKDKNKKKDENKDRPKTPQEKGDGVGAVASPSTAIKNDPSAECQVASFKMDVDKVRVKPWNKWHGFAFSVRTTVTGTKLSKCQIQQLTKSKYTVSYGPDIGDQDVEENHKSDGTRMDKSPDVPGYYIDDGWDWTAMTNKSPKDDEYVVNDLQAFGFVDGDGNETDPGNDTEGNPRVTTAVATVIRRFILQIKNDKSKLVIDHPWGYDWTNKALMVKKTVKDVTTEEVPKSNKEGEFSNLTGDIQNFPWKTK